MPAAAAPPERMSRVDHAWLRMDSAANLMMIVGVWLLEPRLARDELAARLQSSLLAYPRFRQKVVEDAMGALWVEDEAFDLAHHVTRETLAVEPGESPLAALKRRVAALTLEPLDPTRPLWQFALIEDLDGRQSALVSRIHHCIGDGIALISVMLSIADGGKPPPVRRRRVAAEEDTGDGFSDALMRPFTDLTVKAIGMYGAGVGKSMEFLSQPGGALTGSLDAARMGYQVLHDVAALALMPDDSPTRLKGQARPGKRVAWGEPLPLDRVKAVGRVFGASINDVLLSCVAGAIGDYLRSKGDDPTGQEIRAMVPVNLRPLEQAHKLGNRFGLAPLVLPIGIAHPVERLYAVRARMNELKTSYQPLLAFAVLAISGLMIKPVQDAITGMFARKATAVMTNVPGPKEPIRFCGRTVNQVMFWVPQSGDIGMGVSILSYAGGVQFGLITDALMCPDPEAVIERFAPEFERLLWLALMAPWPAQ
ncbi:MAG TPA: wax ester/triacylglycerol synthase family O-acyltransferase [Burkholderiaceae bacterium]|nr:wax ester/triacylglycerol synthase family O-acyltransferase [Burkholderiaceae bacterium]